MRSQCDPTPFSCQKSPITAQVAANIAAHRKKAGMTQRQVADCLSLEKETISRIESGKITVNLERLEQFSLIFRCSIIELLVGDSDPDHISADIASMVTILPPTERKRIMLFIANTVRLFSPNQAPS